jgi:phosphatidylethanolamine-binding protein
MQSPNQTPFQAATEQKPKVGARLFSSAVPFSPTDAYMVFMIDTTAHILQWFELGLTASETSFDLDSTGTSTSESGAPYLAPDPPAGLTHQYVLLLFAQPMGFVVPRGYAAVDPPRSPDARRGFDINHFIAAVAQDGVTSLGGVVAATYFGVKAQEKGPKASVTSSVV